MTLQEKKEAIEKLKAQQLELLDKSVKVAKLPTPKRFSTVIRRAGKVVSYCVHYAYLKTKLQALIATPTE